MTSIQLQQQIEQSKSILTQFARKFTKDPDDIQDLVQETLVKSIRYIDEYENNPKFLSWLYVIMKNVFINQYRRDQKRLAYENSRLSDVRDMGYSEPFSRNNSEGKFTMNDIELAMKKLPAESSEIFNMHIEGYKYREIAEYFNMPEGTVKTRIHHARKFLQAQLSIYKSAS
ncbi:RNA polymerase sigma factor [Sphingobacterium phlebotomi]|uniref:RNA polymerase sigma factor n=1 Tax=Sphingobacterium phlebotomi TaxID=2605433 RepID=A0A5D4HAT1_9SPHI|nr:RNA polymerase sigma factor [Sphingobacterium phlebotomi]TYR36929.1 RNA polymerase sigma factor [Sphingobacterium phlebotomi]